ncbi:MAG: MCE family protein [Deltaproteobacteria bacterium]|jgi:ABC-type transporter Mla subunit MlaD|nr:MCE family protein [Deltaproteobacteria bacterium]MBW2537964.1 MCE family protein [Deltaproteobacteria bacterium]
MATSTGHWKLGLFVLLGLFVAFGAVVWLGAAEIDKDVARYVTYFDESVQGLDVGSPVKFRGVRIGNVSHIGVAPDHRHVEVEAEVDVKELASMGIDSSTMKIPADLRVQLASAGVTGLKFLQVDFFDVDRHPLPELPFRPRGDYIPAAPSTLKSLEDSVVESVGKFPETTDQVNKMLHKINDLLADVNSRRIPGRVVTTINKVNDTVDEGRLVLALTRKKIRRFDVATMSDNMVAASENVKTLTAKGNQTLDNVNSSLIRANRLLARAEKKGGMMDDVEETVKVLKTEAKQLEGTMSMAKATMKSFKATADAFANVARDASTVTGDLGKTLSSVSEAADSIRQVTEVLERDPDMLLKGRARSE